MPRFRLPAFPLPPALKRVSSEVHEYVLFLRHYFRLRGYKQFSRFELAKDAVVDLLYKRRGKYARPFLHLGTVVLTFIVVTFGPYILQQAEQDEGAAVGGTASSQLGLSVYATNFTTLQAEEVRAYRGGEVTAHVVEEGETLSSIALKYGLRVETVLWENNLTEKTKLKPGQELKILPVDGVRHKVARGETIFSVAKKYGLDETQAQAIVNYPFNEFLNDETFELATGQFLVVPDGVKPDPVTKQAPVSRFASVLTPNAGTVTATNSFVWPAAGRITQGYRFYHKAVDIANSGAEAILAADSGSVVAAGWDASGYGNRVIIDHGNGYSTLYAHLSVLQVQAGQTVSRGSQIGVMGSTGRSTGTHLHFEIRNGGVLLNPLSFLN